MYELKLYNAWDKPVISRVGVKPQTILMKSQIAQIQKLTALASKVIKGKDYKLYKIGGVK